MCGATGVVREEIGRSVADEMVSSGPEPFLEAGFVQLLQETAVTMWTGSNTRRYGIER